MKILSLIIPVLLLAGCNVYAPNMVNVPLMKGRNEAHININISNAQASYAITDHFAIMANGYYRTNNVTLLGSTVTSTTRWVGEGGIGFFSPLEKENLIFELFGGAGIGNINFNTSTLYTNYNYVPNFNANFTKAFIQPSIGLTLDNFDIALSGRVVAAQFENIHTTYSEMDLLDYKMNVTSNPYYFFEPALTMRVGFKWVKLQMQTIFVEQLTPDPINYSHFQANVGLHITLGRKSLIQ